MKGKTLHGREPLWGSESEEERKKKKRKKASGGKLQDARSFPTDSDEDEDEDSYDPDSDSLNIDEDREEPEEPEETKVAGEKEPTEPTEPTEPVDPMDEETDEEYRGDETEGNEKKATATGEKYDFSEITAGQSITVLKNNSHRSGYRLMARWHTPNDLQVHGESYARRYPTVPLTWMEYKKRSGEKSDDKGKAGTAWRTTLTDSGNDRLFPCWAIPPPSQLGGETTAPHAVLVVKFRGEDFWRPPLARYLPKALPMNDLKKMINRGHPETTSVRCILSDGGEEEDVELPYIPQCVRDHWKQSSWNNGKIPRESHLATAGSATGKDGGGWIWTLPRTMFRSMEVAVLYDARTREVLAAKNALRKGNVRWERCEDSEFREVSPKDIRIPVGTPKDEESWYEIRLAQWGKKSSVAFVALEELEKHHASAKGVKEFCELCKGNAEWLTSLLKGKGKAKREESEEEEKEVEPGTSSRKNNKKKKKKKNGRGRKRPAPSGDSGSEGEGEKDDENLEETLKELEEQTKRRKRRLEESERRMDDLKRRKVDQECRNMLTSAVKNVETVLGGTGRCDSESRESMRNALEVLSNLHLLPPSP